MSLFFVLFGKREDDPDALVKFKARGLCNFPLIQEGDYIYVRYKKLKDVKVGDVAVFLKNKELISHRVIRVYNEDEQWFLLTRSDNNLIDHDQLPVSRQNYVGIVEKVSRNGFYFKPEKKNLTKFQRFINSIRMKIISSWNRFLLRLKKGWYFLRVLFFQDVRNFFSNPSGKYYISFDKYSSINVNWLRRVFLTTDLLDPDLLKQLTDGSWQMTFSSDDVVHAFVIFNRIGDYVFLSHYFVNVRFWGTSIEKDIQGKIDAFCRFSGFEKIFAFAKTYAGKILLEKRGFSLTNMEISPSCRVYYEYLESQQEPQSYHIKNYRWVLSRHVPANTQTSTDAEILGIL